MRYAIVGADNRVINTVEASDGFAGGIQSDKANVGDLWLGGTRFEAPAAIIMPEIVITSIACDKPGAEVSPDFSDITCQIGSVITCRAELRNEAGVIIPLTDSFRMPLKSSDGRERFVLVAFESGIATFSGAMNESGLWSINQDAINSRLPQEKHMAMDEVLIYVCI